MIKWEYQLVSLAAPTTDQSDNAPAVAMLNQGGAQGWEAVGLTTGDQGRQVVLFKRPLAEARASGGRV